MNRQHWLAFISTPGIFTALILLSGCVTDPDSLDKPVTVQYSCADGQQITVRFYNREGRAELDHTGKTMSLQQQVSASGFYYSNGRYGLRGKGNSAQLEVGRMAPIECQDSPPDHGAES